MKTLKINYAKDGKISSIIEKNNWMLKSIFEIFFLGGIMVYLAFYITDSLNPNPEIKVSCSIANSDRIIFNLTNPSKSPAEEFNLLIYEEYGGSSGFSYIINELCDIDYFNENNKYTLIHCDYIPPLTTAIITVSFKDKFVKEFGYNSWGKTTPKKDDRIIRCDMDAIILR